jgi:hypothetical protein
MWGISKYIYQIKHAYVNECVCGGCVFCVCVRVRVCGRDTYSGIVIHTTCTTYINTDSALVNAYVH